jgi:hypothetical protein
MRIVMFNFSSSRFSIFIIYCIPHVFDSSTSSQKKKTILNLKFWKFNENANKKKNGNVIEKI